MLYTHTYNIATIQTKHIHTQAINKPRSGFKLGVHSHEADI